MELYKSVRYSCNSIRISALKRRNCHSCSAKLMNEESAAEKMAFEKNSAKPFGEIPGPKSLPLIGTTWKYFPIIGSYKTYDLVAAKAMQLKEYGPIVREEIVPGTWAVSVFDPADIERVYKAEGKTPARRSHLAVQHYRLSKPDLYNSGGLLPTNGDEWWRLRSAFQKSLSRIQNVRQFLPTADSIVEEFLDNLFIPGRDIDDFQILAARLGLELTWTAMFGSRLGRMEISEDVPSRLMQAAETTNCNILETDNSQRVWTRWKTPAYKRIEENLSYIESIVIPALEKKRKEVEAKKSTDWEPVGLIEHYFNLPGVDFKDITGMAIDLVLGGIDTTSYTSSFLVWHLTQNRRAQEKCRDESQRLLGDGLKNETLANSTYARAVLKETFRLNPISIGISRNLAESAVLAGYFVPKGTLVITQNLIACRQERHFENPLLFQPERWIKGSEHCTQVSPYLILPFSHGPRTCIARRLAEQNLLTFLLKVTSRYRLEWRGENELKVVTPLICKPAKPVKISVHSWE